MRSLTGAKTKLGAPPSVVPTFTPDELNEMNYRASLEAFVKASLNEEALKVLHTNLLSLLCCSTWLELV